jgi:hypothetical protein
MFFDDISEFLIHHSLECRWGISKSEEHDQRFEKPIFGFEGCFVLVSFFDADVVISLSDIKFREYGHILYLCD